MRSEQLRTFVLMVRRLMPVYAVNLYRAQRARPTYVRHSVVAQMFESADDVEGHLYLSIYGQAALHILDFLLAASERLSRASSA